MGRIAHGGAGADHPMHLVGEALPLPVPRRQTVKMKMQEIRTQAKAVVLGAASVGALILATAAPHKFG